MAAIFLVGDSAPDCLEVLDTELPSSPFSLRADEEDETEEWLVSGFRRGRLVGEEGSLVLMLILRPTVRTGLGVST